MVKTLNINDMLEGATKFQEWNGMVLILLENDLKEYVEVMVASPTNI